MDEKLYKNKYRIKTLRLQWWDYSKDGDYFITIRTNQKGNIFGKLLNDDIVLNSRGKIVKKYILEIPDHFGNVKLRSWVIMPDHIHFILRIRNNRNLVETQHRCVSNENNESKTFYKLKPGSIPVIVRSFKSICTRTIHSIENNKQFKWQRSFYDKVIFNDQVLQEIEIYIRHNPKSY